MAQSRNSASGALILFLIQPFLGFLLSLKNLASRSGRIIFIAFSTLWGYAQSFTYTPADCYRLAASFCQYPIRSFSKIVSMFADGKAIDGYLISVNYIVHLFSNNAKVFFAFLGLVYGILSYEALATLIKERKNANNGYLSAIIFLFFSVSSIANMAMPRFWTAAWLSTLIFVKITQGNKRWVFLSLLLPMIHFSFVPIAVAMFIIPLIGHTDKFTTILFIVVTIMFVLSYVLPETVIGRLIPQDMIDENTKLASKYGYVDGIHSDRIYRQTSAYREANHIITHLFHVLMKVGSYLLIIFCFSNRQKISSDVLLRKSFFAVLVLAFASYFMSIIPSTGWRFINVLWLFILAFLYRFYDLIRPRKFFSMSLFLYAVNIYTISFMLYLTYRTVDLVLFYAPSPFIIMSGIGFPPVFFV